MKKVLIIYHREDNDGLCSAGIVRSWLTRYPIINDTQYKPEDFEFYGVNYADLSADWEELQSYSNSYKKTPNMKKWRKFEAIFMVDISFNSIDAMNHMYETFGQNFHWCDHHHPIIQASTSQPFGNAPGIRRTDQSALMNTWDYLANLLADKRQTFQKIQPSKYLIMLSDYDSWTWKNKPWYAIQKGEDELMALNTGVTRYSNLNIKWFNNWIGALLDDDGFHDTMANDAWNYGRIAYKLDTERAERAIRAHGDTRWIVRTKDADYKACAIITTDRINSVSFKSLRGTDIVRGLVFKIDADNDNVLMSMYNINDGDDFDCGAWLKENYGGGGHKGAAGCTISRQQFMLMFESRIV